MDKINVGGVYGTSYEGILVDTHYGLDDNTNEPVQSYYLKVDEKWLNERIDERISSQLNNVYSIPKETLIIGPSIPFSEEDHRYLQGDEDYLVSAHSLEWFGRLSNIIEGRIISRLVSKYHPEAQGIIDEAMDLETTSLNALADYLEEKKLDRYARRIRLLAGPREERNLGAYEEGNPGD